MNKIFAVDQTIERLFSYIHSIGSCIDYNGIICVLDNKGPNAKDNSYYYFVFVKGGILFEIWKEETENGPDYYFEIIWAGPWEAQSATDVLASITILAHGKPEAGIP